MRQTNKFIFLEGSHSNMIIYQIAIMQTRFASICAHLSWL